jgi:hypothetical protein
MTGTTATTTDGRLMCASTSTYHIGVDDCSPPPTGNEFLFGSGLQHVKTFCSPNHTNACLVGTNDDGVVIAFRGTLPINFEDPTVTSIIDWLENDFDVPMTSVPQFGAGVEVHSGWWDDLETIWPSALACARGLLDSGSSLYITGHSKGGPLAALAGACATIEEGLHPHVVTFASPSPGNAAFAALFGGSGIPSRNYENYGDIIPLLPPTLDQSVALDLEFVTKITELTDAERILLAGALTATAELGYEPVCGDVRYIDLDGTVGPAPDVLTRAANVGAAFTDGGIERVLASHCSACYAVDPKTKEVTCAGGYMKGTTQAEICG